MPVYLDVFVVSIMISARTNGSHDTTLLQRRMAITILIALGNRLSKVLLQAPMECCKVYHVPFL
ncbi:hypothetical protein BDB00DRAFT_846893 [Zychaea mexicana]|uniref:uncharacterized protein n=1 Tax=Zychaea mexicana TaxID=64656 RepID=UPI0022FF0F71|nr:uncharacterized protein BDB00DRAFT_846893 [Zychaea mexicana]KAI9488767.1 hypothetical protein BDB00DRAFT_846893 [Zychaea mexicana]